MEWVKSFYFKKTALVVAAALFLVSVFPAESLSYVIDGGVAAPHATRAVDMERVRRVLESRLVSERLKTLGMSGTEIKARLSKLTDAELHQFAKKIDSLYPGGDAAGVIISLLVIAVLVVILLKLLHRKIVIE